MKMQRNRFGASRTLRVRSVLTPHSEKLHLEAPAVMIFCPHMLWLKGEVGEETEEEAEAEQESSSVGVGEVCVENRGVGEASSEFLIMQPKAAWKKSLKKIS